MPGPGGGDPGAIGQLASNLFNGWGYNFYRLENQLRSDDLMVRAKLSELLAATRRAVEAAEHAYRIEHLPPPSRAKPRHDPECVRNAQLLEALGQSLGMLEGHVRALPAPENDRMTQRFRREAETLSRLLEADQAMIGHAEFLRSLLMSAAPAWVLDNLAPLREQIAAIETAIQARRDLLAF